MRGGLLLLAALVATVPAVAAQGGGEAIPETMALTDQAPPGASAPSSPDCGTPRLYGIADPGEGPDAEAKAYASRSSMAVGCPTLFRGPSPGAFNLTADVQVHLFVGCDAQTVMHEPLNNLRVWLTRNGEALGEGQAALGPVCSPGTPMEAEVTIEPPEDPTFNATDTIGVNATPFGSPNLATDNLHFLVGGNESASTLTLPGLSQALASDDAEEESVEETNETEEFPNGSDVEPQSEDVGGGIPAPGAALTVGALGGLAVLAATRRRG